jgi:hypothetical protein
MTEGVCTGCGAPARTQVQVMTGAGLASVGVYCRDCQRLLMEDSARVAAGGPPFDPVDSGATMPAGALTRSGTCAQCGAARDVTRSIFHAFGNKGPIKLICAECLTDLIAGIAKYVREGGATDAGVLYVETGPDRFQRVGYE